MSKFTNLSETELYQIDGGATFLSRATTAVRFAYEMTFNVIVSVFESLLKYFESSETTAK
jgi:hypothetical protein